MTRSNPIYFHVPEDLWVEFEAQCPSAGPLPHLKHALDDALTSPQRLAKTVEKVLTRPRLRSDTMVRKGVRWPTETWDGVLALAAKLHTTKEGLIRLVIEGEVRQ